ncbi:MAG TPA: sugar ABC transporter permease [Reyranella sp.]|nr:sugar ABC transporter permease [Reyranella sp.]
MRLSRWATFGPALLLMLVLGVLPLANLFYTSFHTVTWAAGKATFTPAGIGNYLALPADPLLRAGFFNTIVFAVGAVGGQMVLGFGLALLCSRVTRGRVLYRAVFILPILIPGIVIGAIWKLMLNFDFGLVNQITDLVGMDPRNWLGDRQTALASVIAVDIWHWTPFCFLLLLAGLESLPQDPYEAAKIDGASWWQELRYITLPLMAPAILVTFAFRLVIAFKVFDEIYLLTGGGPVTATEVLSFTLFQRLFTEDREGYGSAMAVAIIFLCSLLLVVAVSVGRRSERAA